MVEAFARLRDARFVRYFLASVGALAVDVGLFFALLTAGIASPLASAVGYSAGIVAHWLMSSRAVFSDSVAARGAARTRQKAQFVLSALAGLGLTTGIMAAAHAVAFDPRLAKLVAVGASFVLTWILRRHVVFGTKADGLAG